MYNIRMSSKSPEIMFLNYNEIKNIVILRLKSNSSKFELETFVQNSVFTNFLFTILTTHGL